MSTVDDECISDAERSLEKLERAVRATKVRYHWVDNTVSIVQAYIQASSIFNSVFIH